MILYPQQPGRPDLYNVQRIDLMPVPMLRHMQNTGIAVDREYFGDLSQQFDREMTDLRLKICDVIPDEALDAIVSSSGVDSEGDEDAWLDYTVNPNSAAQVSKLLWDHLKLDVGEDLKMTPDGTRISTGKKQLERIKRKHPVVPLILEYRELGKLKGTYADALPKAAVLHKQGRSGCDLCGKVHKSDTWRIHTEFVLTRTDTGRMASRKPNLTNIPARTKRGQMIRNGFVATKGKRLTTNDFSQIELRLLAHLAQEQAMLDVFRNGGDIHLETACRAFDLDTKLYYRLAKLKEEKKLTGDDVRLWEEFSLCYRGPCKNVNFGIVYGLMAKGLLDLMAVTFATAGIPLPAWVTLEWCEEFIEKWFALYPGVKEFLGNMWYRARRYEMTWSPFGGLRRIPEVRSCHKWIQNAGLRQGANNVIQRLAAEVLKIAAGIITDTLWQAGMWGTVVDPLLFIHDEIVMEADEDVAEDVVDLVSACMNSTGDGWCTVPVGSDGKTMERWRK